MQKLIKEAGLVRGGLKLSFLYIIIHIKTPTWSIDPPSVNAVLAEFPKKSTPEGFYQHEFQKLMEEYISIIGIYSQTGPKQRLELELQQ